MLIDFYTASDYSFSRRNFKLFLYIFVCSVLSFVSSTALADEERSSFTDILQNFFSRTETVVVKTGETTKEIASSAVYTIAGATDINSYMSGSAQQMTEESPVPAALINQGRFIDSKQGNQDVSYTK